MAELTLEQYMQELVAKARVAQKEFENSHLEAKDQHDVDAICRAVGMACMTKIEELAAAAVAQTGMGDIGSKIGKMAGVALMTWNDLKGKKSIGVIDDCETYPGVQIVAKPLGVIGATMPSTNPIVTIIHNSMSAIKCRNAIIIASHPASVAISEDFVDMIRDTLKEMGAPEDLVQCIDSNHSSKEATALMMELCDVNVATGGPGMVKAVYSAGKPAFGVGQGNAQAIIDDDCPDMTTIATTIIFNRSADQGVPCTGEQMVHVSANKVDEFVEEITDTGAFEITDEAVIEKLRQVAFPDGKNINRDIVGKTPYVVGQMLGIDVPEDAMILLVKVTGKGDEDVLCKEMLFPIVRYRVYENFEEGFDALLANLYHEGAGHSSAIWSNVQEHIDYAMHRVPVGRFHVNQATAGSMNGMPPTVTIGCGSWGGNSMSENLTFRNLMNKTHVTHNIDNWHSPDPGDFDIWE